MRLSQIEKFEVVPLYKTINSKIPKIFTFGRGLSRLRQPYTIYLRYLIAIILSLWYTIKKLLEVQRGKNYDENAARRDGRQ